MVKGSEDWQLHPPLHPVSTDHVIHKQHGSALQETGLDDELKSCKIDTVEEINW